MSRSSWLEFARRPVGEHVHRAARARLRVRAPGWWEGTLSLTDTRLFFLPDVIHPSERAGVWHLGEISAVRDAGRRRLTIAVRGRNVMFEIDAPPLSVRALRERLASTWIEAIDDQRAMRQRRAAG